MCLSWQLLNCTSYSVLVYWLCYKSTAPFKIHTKIWHRLNINFYRNSCHSDSAVAIKLTLNMSYLIQRFFLPASAFDSGGKVSNKTWGEKLINGCFLLGPVHLMMLKRES